MRIGKDPFNNQKTALPAERKEFLDQRFQKHARVQPKILELKKTLAKLGGSHIVVPAMPAPERFFLIESGFTMFGSVVFKTMEPVECHLNSATLWVLKHPVNPGGKRDHRARLATNNVQASVSDERGVK